MHIIRTKQPRKWTDFLPLEGQRRKVHDSKQSPDVAMGSSEQRGGRLFLFLDTDKLVYCFVYCSKQTVLIWCAIKYKLSKYVQFAVSMKHRTSFMLQLITFT